MNSKVLSAGLVSAMLLGVPLAFAADNGTSANAQTPAHHDADRIVTDSINVVQRVKSDNHFDSLMKRAKGVVIIPHLVKAAAVVGAEGGQGLLLAHRDGRWSNPAFISVGSISVGAQVGGKEGPLVMLLMTDKALNDFTQANNFSLNANAGLTIVNYSARGQGGFGKGDVVVWSGAGGGFIGASVSGSDFTSNSARDASFYGKQVSTQQIAEGKVHNPAARKLVDTLPT